MMVIFRVLGVFFITSLLPGCMYHTEIVRPAERRVAVDFSSSSAREAFICTLRQIETFRPRDKKAKESTSAHLLIFTFYQRHYVLSDAAYFNHLVGKADLNKNQIITKDETNLLYSSYFPSHRYISTSPDSSFFTRLKAKLFNPRCDIHPEAQSALEVRGSGEQRTQPL